MNKNGFNKKIYSFSLLREDLSFFFKNRKGIRQMKGNPQITKAFFERIMTVVTAVNGCVYCSWFHAKQAVASGIEKEEVKNLFELQFKAKASDFELPALLYAQHFAETDRKPDAEMKQMLIDKYGKDMAYHITLIIRMIFFGNLAGNTFDAFISRLKGKKAPHSNALFETLFFIVNIPFLLPLMPLVKKYR